MAVSKTTNNAGQEIYEGVELSTKFDDLDFHTPKYKFETDVQVALHTNLGSFTVLDRMTGFGNGAQDIESGYRDLDGNFWLASGGYDTREARLDTVGDAIKWVKDRANTCTGDRIR